MYIYKYMYTRSLGPLLGPTSSWSPFGPLGFALVVLVLCEIFDAVLRLVFNCN